MLTYQPITGTPTGSIPSGAESIKKRHRRGPFSMPARRSPTLSHPGLTRSLSLLAVSALVLGACGSPSNGRPAKQGPVVVDGAVDLPALQQLVDSARSRSPEQQEAELARLNNVLERQLWTESGLEAALGGAAAADAAFAAHGRALTGRARALADKPIVMVPAVYAAEPSGPTIGEGLFGGMLLVSLGADGVVSSSNDLKDGEHVAPDRSNKEIQSSGSRDHVDLDMNFTHESDGVTTKLVVKVGVSPCPDANGHFEATAKVDVSATKTGGSTGQRGTLDVTITGEVDDDATLASTDAEYRMQYADFANSKGGFVDVSGALSGPKARSATLNRTGGTPNSRHAGDGGRRRHAVHDARREQRHQGGREGLAVGPLRDSQADRRAGAEAPEARRDLDDQRGAPQPDRRRARRRVGQGEPHRGRRRGQARGQQGEGRRDLRLHRTGRPPTRAARCRWRPGRAEVSPRRASTSTPSRAGTSSAAAPR
nr:hypothetical protein GCM10020092_043860 [Actinoplanes digitatis]